MVIAATNRINAIDPALRRGGRFDREIEIGVPDKQGRLDILQIHSRGMPLAEDFDIEKIARITHGFVGADLAMLVKEAAMSALRNILPKINWEEETVPPEILQEIEVKQLDFDNALAMVEPSALREVFVENPDVKWEEIGGLEDAIQQLKEAVEWPLKYPEVFEVAGISPPTGILLYGPPGTGKTLLAKAVATESEANFICIKGPEVMSKWVGESEKAVREIFRKAKMSAPTIVFFDEIDSLAPKRGSGFGDSGTTERVISQLLTEIDGLEMIKHVIIIAATNRPDIVDSALLRPGRFDRFVLIPPPGLKAREKILEIFTKNMPLADDVKIKELAKLIDGYSGADVESLCREAAMLSLRDDMNSQIVELKHFKAALKKVQASITPEMMKYYENAKERFKRSTVEVAQLSPVI